MQTVIGHRGAAGYAPENTLVSFNKARELGCCCIEFDVMLSSDGEPFIFHDERLKRTTRSRGEVGKVTAEYLQSLDAGRWFSRSFQGEKIPTLKEAIEWLVHHDMHANIEIKPYPGTMEQTTIAVLAHINRYWPREKESPLISSFDEGALSLFHSLAPDIPIGLLLDKWNENWLKKAQDLNCYSVHLSQRITTLKRVTCIKEAGYKVFVYTVNRKRKARKLLSWGVDALFSDFPDLLS